MPGKRTSLTDPSRHADYDETDQPRTVLASPSRAGTAADLTTPPVTGAPAQASAKTASPIEGSDAGKAAKALASRRESTTLDKAKQGTSGGTKAQLKEFVEDDRHFSLVR